MSIDRPTGTISATDKNSSEYKAKRAYLLKQAAKYNPFSDEYKSAVTEPFDENIYREIHDDFLGESTRKFQNLELLHAYIEDIISEKELSLGDRANVTALRDAVSKFEAYLLADISEEKISQVISELKLSLMPDNLHPFEYIVQSISRGFDKMAAESEKVAAQINAVIATDKHAAARKNELGIMMLKVMVSIFSSTVGDIVATAIKNAAPGGNPDSALATFLAEMPSEPIKGLPQEDAARRLQLAAEKLTEISYKDLADDVVRKYKQAYDDYRREASESTLASIMRRFVTSEGAIHRTLELLKPQLLSRLQKLDHSEVASKGRIPTIIAREIVVPAIKTIREDLINHTIKSLSTIQRQAHIVETGVAPADIGKEHAAAHNTESRGKILSDMAKEMHMQYASRILSSHFHHSKIIKTSGYTRTANADVYPGFEAFTRADSKESVTYLPKDIASPVLANLFESKVGKKEMQIGGRRLRNHLYNVLAINHQSFGLKEQLKWEITSSSQDKARMRDFWRAEQIMTVIFAQHAPALPSNKSPADFAFSLLHIMHADVFFKQHHSQYPTDEKTPTNSPLHLLLNTPEHMNRLKNPEVKAEMKQYLDGDPLKFVLRMLTDVNLKSTEDNNRMRYALKNILEVLKEVDIKPEKLAAIKKEGESYIHVQLDFARVQDEIRDVINRILNDSVITGFEDRFHKNKTAILDNLNILLLTPLKAEDRANALKVIKENIQFIQGSNTAFDVENNYLQTIQSIVSRAEKANLYQTLDGYRKQANASEGFDTIEDYKIRLVMEDKSRTFFQTKRSAEKLAPSDRKTLPPLDLPHNLFGAAPQKTAVQTPKNKEQKRATASSKHAPMTPSPDQHLHVSEPSSPKKKH